MNERPEASSAGNPARAIAAPAGVRVTLPSTVRRRLLACGALLAATGMPARAAIDPRGTRPGSDDRAGTHARIALLNTHTGERIDVVYREAGGYVPEALAAIDRVLRDHRTGEVAPIDPQLLDLVHRLGAMLVTQQPFHVISGYRSPATNAKLAAASDGVARASLHLSGRAIDLRLPGRPLTELRSAAMRLASGGVGFYPRSEFVHVDTGRVRAW